MRCATASDVVDRRRHAAYRGSRRPFGRQRLLAAALQPRAARSSPRSSARPRRWPGRSGSSGLMNVQFAVKDGVVYLIEVNPRASRTVPFVAKAIGVPIAKIAARVMAGEKLADLPPIDRDIAYIAVKEAVFPFARFPGIDPVLVTGNEVDRRSHGNRSRFCRPPSSSRSSARAIDLPDGGTLFVSVKDSDKPRHRSTAVRELLELGFKVDRHRRHRRLSRRGQGLPVERVNKVAAGPAAHRRQDQGRRGRARSSTPPRAGRATRTPPSIRASALDEQGSLLHHRARRASRWRRRSRRCREQRP